MVDVLRLPFAFGDDGNVVPFEFSVLPCSSKFTASRGAVPVPICPFAIFKLLIFDPTYSKRAIQKSGSSQLRFSQ